MIELKNVTLLFPAIYKPQMPFDDAKARYGASFAAGDVNNDKLLFDAGIRPRNTAPDNAMMYNARSTIAPTVNVEGDKYDDLIRAYQIADVRNVGRDRLFRNAVVDMRVSTYEYDTRYGSGVGMGIVSLTILDVQAIIKAAYEFERQS